MIDLGERAAFIVASYGVSALGLVGLTVYALMRGRG